MDLIALKRVENFEGSREILRGINGLERGLNEGLKRSDGRSGLPTKPRKSFKEPSEAVRVLFLCTGQMILKCSVGNLVVIPKNAEHKLVQRSRLPFMSGTFSNSPRCRQIEGAWVQINCWFSLSVQEGFIGGNGGSKTQTALLIETLNEPCDAKFEA